MEVTVEQNSQNTIQPNIDAQPPKYLGMHLLVDFWNCNVTEDAKKLEQIFRQAAKVANCQPLEVAIHKFSPQGITGVIVLAESHISLHSWPERNYASIDIFTCGEKSKPHAALEYLKQEFKPEKIHVLEERRGETEENQKVFGQELSLDLYDCNPEVVRSKEKILQYSGELCDLIDMKRYGKPFIERFAEHSEVAAGYSLAQMIETSLISGHFSEFWNRAYLNIFSCKTFDVEIAKNFSMEFFGAKDGRSKLNIR